MRHLVHATKHVLNGFFNIFTSAVTDLGGIKLQLAKILIDGQPDWGFHCCLNINNYRYLGFILTKNREMLVLRRFPSGLAGWLPAFTAVLCFFIPQTRRVLGLLPAQYKNVKTHSSKCSKHGTVVW